MRNTESIINVLLTDDDGDDQILFEEAIREIPRPVEFHSVDNGKHLLNFLHDNYNPSLIFLDLNMPGKNGKECLREIKATPSLHDIPVIMYSTSSNKEDIETCYGIGADLYVVKPYLFSDIVKMLEKVFSIDWKNSTRRSKDEFVL